MINYNRVKILLLVALSACNDENTSTHKQIEIDPLSNKETIKEEPIVVKVFFNYTDSIYDEYSEINSTELFSIIESDSIHKKKGQDIKVILNYKGYTFSVDTLGNIPTFGPTFNHFSYIEMNDSFMNYIKDVPVNNFVFEMFADQSSDVKVLLDSLIKYKITDKSERFKIYIYRRMIE